MPVNRRNKEDYSLQFNNLLLNCSYFTEGDFVALISTTTGYRFESLCQNFGVNLLFKVAMVHMQVTLKSEKITNETNKKHADYCYNNIFLHFTVNCCCVYVHFYICT